MAQNASSSQGAGETNQQAAQGQNTQEAQQNTGIESLNLQMIMIFFTIVASMLAIATLHGIKEQQSGCFPNKDYSYLKTLTRVGVAITALATLYFAYLAWLQRERNPEDTVLTWLFVANLFAVGAVLIKLDVTYLDQNATDDDLEEVLE